MNKKTVKVFYHGELLDEFTYHHKRLTHTNKSKKIDGKWNRYRVPNILYFYKEGKKEYYRNYKVRLNKNREIYRFEYDDIKNE